MADDQRPSSSSRSDSAEEILESCHSLWPDFEETKKIRETCRSLWPSANHARTWVGSARERAKVAEYDIGITYAPDGEELRDGKFDEYYVMEIPHLAHEDAVVEHENTLRFVGGGTGTSSALPETVRGLVPRVFHVDSTRQNPLKWPFMVATRPRHGLESLEYTYHYLSQEQKVQVATQLGRIYREEGDDDDEKTKQHGGIVKRFPMLSKDDDDVKEDQIDWDAMLNALPDDDDSTFTRADFLGDVEPGTKAGEILLSSILRWAHRLRYCKGPRPKEENPLLVENVFSFSDEEDDNYICLHNGNLSLPANIQIEFFDDNGDGAVVDDPDQLRAAGEPRITGIRDWDATAFEPRFAGCRPPSWLWDFPDPQDFAQVEKTTLHIYNLPRWAQEVDVRAAFSQFGRVTRVRRTIEIGKLYDNWGHVSFASPEAAREAIRHAHRRCFRFPRQQEPLLHDQDAAADGDLFCKPPNKYEGDHTPYDYNDYNRDGLRVGYASLSWYEREMREDPYCPRHERMEPLEPESVEPTHALAAEVKRAFDEATGPAFCEAAYGEDMVLARRFWQVVRGRPWRTADKADWDELWLLVRRAEDVRPEKMRLGLAGLAGLEKVRGW
ncbi:hypothetical protein PG996_002647 [Apiospora saccharicola]|uniref:RRM domain-containing protein n=1 Tax=Apiospora saccharicola TaxID=335842 RepID=A0ABR1WK38_9PEZI